MKNLLVLTATKTTSMSEFIDFWKKFYDYKVEGYVGIIDEPQFNEGQLERLFEWKNGMSLSGKKSKGFQQKILSRLHDINAYKQSGDFVAMLNDFEEVSAVWRAFLFHIIAPDKFPIYDQHIHRAYQYIHGEQWEDISSTTKDDEKMDFYKFTYAIWFNFHKPQRTKDLDDAMFSFGQFLNTKKYRKFFIES